MFLAQNCGCERWMLERRINAFDLLCYRHAENQSLKR